MFIMNQDREKLKKQLANLSAKEKKEFFKWIDALPADKRQGLDAFETISIAKRLIKEYSKKKTKKEL